MKKSAIIVGVVSALIWILQIGPLGVITGILGMIMSKEAFQEYPRVAFGLSLFGFIMGLLTTIGIFAPLALVGGLVTIGFSNPVLIVILVIILVVAGFVVYKKRF